MAADALDLDTAMTPRRTGEATWTWQIADGWQQGRGIFGGLQVGALIHAGEAAVADATRALRAVTAEIVAPATPGAAAIEVTPVRTGSSVVVLRAELRSPAGGDVVAHAVLTFGRDRDAERWVAIEPPVLPPWREVAVAPVGPPSAPVFTQHFELRPLTGLPFDGGARNPEAIGWVRPRPGMAGASRGAAYIAACIDAYWPAALAGGTPRRAMSTLTFTLLVVGDLRGLDPDAPLAYRARSLAGAAGYVPELRELWGEDGRLIAINPQTFAT
jgi:acyl-coenzyme A thioesterase PaaI-like protein